jgi:hypothetical protein
MAPLLKRNGVTLASRSLRTYHIGVCLLAA